MSAERQLALQQASTHSAGMSLDALLRAASDGERTGNAVILPGAAAAAAASQSNQGDPGTGGVGWPVCETPPHLGCTIGTGTKHPHCTIRQQNFSVTVASRYHIVTCHQTHITNLHMTPPATALHGLALLLHPHPACHRNPTH